MQQAADAAVRNHVHPTDQAIGGLAGYLSADLVLIRQVLQHLTNEQISRILANLEASEWRHALITEEIGDRSLRARGGECRR